MKNIVLLVIGLTICLTSHSQTKKETLETLFIDWITSVKSGKTSTIQKFVKDEFADDFISFMTVDKVLNMSMQLHENLPKPFKIDIQYNDGQKIAGLLHNPKNSLGLIINTLPSGKIRGWSETEITWNSKNPNRKSQQEIVNYLNRVLDSLNIEGFSMSVTIGDSRQSFFQKNIGIANQSFQIPVDASTKFNMASSSKMFTSVAIRILEAQGKLKLSDPVVNYLNLSLDPTITIADLLNHTSGLKTFFSSEFWLSSKADLQSWHDLLDYADLSVKKLEETAYFYSNTGFLLLGLIIEQVTGDSYQSVLQKNIFRPADMSKTLAVNKYQSTSKKATGYTRVYPVVDSLKASVEFQQKRLSEATFPNDFFSNTVSSPAGGMYTVSDDLFNFIKFVASGLMSKETTPNMMRQRTVRHFSFIETKGYNNGFEVNTYKDQSYWGHSGSIPGFNSIAYHFPTIDVTIVILSNSDDQANKLFAMLKDFLF
ncbi:serine hydrolase [Winogradskyella sp.]|uniref:serine hydrolase domain-containing protein n=1 Tax=Winogradskyella sp. TaxID=1883156 RepID=UPI002626A27A|nr:serine hydrolase domain-containing protein [Winogradskyella sp.]